MEEVQPVPAGDRNFRCSLVDNCVVLIISMAFDIPCYNGDAQVINKLTVMSYMLIKNRQYNNVYETFIHKRKSQYNNNSASIVNIFGTYTLYICNFSFAVGLSSM
jgi:hypothetical protein